MTRIIEVTRTVKRVKDGVSTFSTSNYTEVAPPSVGIKTTTVLPNGEIVAISEEECKFLIETAIEHLNQPFTVWL